MKKHLLKKLIVILIMSSATCLNSQTAAALDFDGIDDYASAPTFTASGNNNFSIETAVKITTISPNNQFIVYNGNSASDGYGFFLAPNSLSLSILFGGVAFNNTNYTLTPGTWTYLTATFNTGTLSLYVNGSLYQTISTSNPVSPATGSFVIGSDPTGSSNLMGSIDETRLWTRVLCPSEILNNYNGEFASIQPGLLAYYRFNQGIASGSNTAITSVIDDVSGSNLMLNNFSLTGATSNWIAPGSIVSGNYVTPFVSISGSTVVCQGNSTPLTASTSATSYTWSTGSNNLSISVSPTTSTIYSIAASSTAGCMGSAAITVSVNPCAGIKNLNTAAISITIYPNPSNGIFNIDLNENAEIKVFDLLGNLITKLETKTHTVLDLHKYGAGFYIANITVNGEHRSVRLIVQ